MWRGRGIVSSTQAQTAAVAPADTRPLPRRNLDVVLSHYIVCPETRAILVTDFPFPFYERTCARVSVMRRWIIGQ
jgi:hypothetical protein